MLIFVLWTLGQMSRPPEYRTGLSWFIAAHSFRWRWPDKVLIMPSHMRYHSRRRQWSPCIKGFALWLSLPECREKIFFRREMPLTWWKTTKHFQTDRQTHALKFPDVFACQWWWMVMTVCLYSTSTALHGALEMEMSFQEYFFFSKHVRENCPGIFWLPLSSCWKWIWMWIDSYQFVGTISRFN